MARATDRPTDRVTDAPTDVKTDTVTEAPDGAAAERASAIPSWTTVLPPAAVVVLAAVWGRDLAPLLVAAVALVLAGAVLAAVHHAESSRTASASRSARWSSPSPSPSSRSPSL